MAREAMELKSIGLSLPLTRIYEDHSRMKKAGDSIPGPGYSSESLRDVDTVLAVKGRGSNWPDRVADV